MKLTYENANYAATVVAIKVIKPFENCDNIVGAPIFGFQAIVSKDTEVGALGIVFPAECQLSEDYTKANNLYRHAEKNADVEQKGYLEDNRRVKAIKFRGHQSDCLFMPFTSLAYLKVDLSKLKEGDILDSIDGKEICKKYVIKTKQPNNQLQKNKKPPRVDEKFMPKHFDTDNYWKNKDAIPDFKQVIVTQKLHGTSVRIGHVPVTRKLKLREKVAKKLGVKVITHYYDMVYGSRNVVKDANNPDQTHFYSHDLWTKVGKTLDGLVPEGYVIYGEIIGFTDEGAAIQPDYTYNVKQGQELYIYRIAHVNIKGYLVDLTWDQVKEFCTDRALKHVPELWRGEHQYFKADNWINKRFGDPHVHVTYVDALPLSGSKKLVDEGVCVRVDGLSTYILKAKSPIFLQWETKMLDKEVADLEAEA